jgi:hypothetical protein
VLVDLDVEDLNRPVSAKLGLEHVSLNMPEARTASRCRKPLSYAPSQGYHPVTLLFNS